MPWALRPKPLQKQVLSPVGARLARNDASIWGAAHQHGALLSCGVDITGPYLH